ncbi:MAG: outer membrane lipoprotein-sorting protein [FCB group bacterium]|nr:outer membrane lipoprotein-sorting protein [FCB group bacterium]
MKNGILPLLGLVLSILHAQYPPAEEILKKIDANLVSKNRVAVTTMIIHGRRGSRSVSAKSWIQGDEKSFTEYLAPPREKGTKMLKIGDRLWMYSPATDRIIRIAGHMLRQSLMGSDLSYEDMMEDPKLSNLYNAEIVGSEELNNRDCWVLELTARTTDVAYYSRRVWVDKERSLVLKENRYAKSGKLLKTTEVKEVFPVDGRWYPKKILFKDMLSKGKGTELIIESIEFDVPIPDYIFSKAALRK